jgi:dipeptidase E
MSEEEAVTRHIVGLGGGGFSMEPENRLLDDFILSLSRRRPARLCLIPTASGDESSFILSFYRAFSGRAICSDLTLIEARRTRSTDALERFVLEQDIVYVSGGSSVNLLALWRAHGLDRILRTAWENGVVLAGISAGLVCWFEDSITSSFGAPTRLGGGLGLLKGSACPHYDASPGRRARYRSMIGEGLPEGYGVDDSAALHFVGTELVEVVSSISDAAAYRVTATQEERLPTRFLGAPSA